jgi:HlyD family secretion protein
VNTATQTLNAAVNTNRNNVSAVTKAEEQLKLLREGNTAETIAAQRAQAQSAAAGVSSAAASLNKTRLIAPFDGIVTRIAYKTGESVAQTDVVMTLMSDAAFEVETFVSENDAPKLKIGQKASITLDALGDGIVFEAMISEVDLSETIKDGVVTYKTRIQFISQDERIKSGLTANVTVESDRRLDVLKVPQSAIVIQKGKKYVKQVSVDAENWNPALDKTAQLIPVSTGGIDREGDIEIVQGLVAGNKVIIKADK